ncbi:GNAT family N-acetyltransferase [Patescibacteria group bacterium AH-259-L07]|nr:GNAT family N-acetyltransferase [Patescibacteria group bacterium AH-259-L07]
MSNTTIRQAKLSDLDQVLALLYQLSPPTKDEKNVGKKRLRRKLDQIIQDPNHYLCVYEFDGKIRGAATLLVQLNLSHGGRPFGHIENVVTDGSKRGTGIGKQIVLYLLELAKQRNCYKVILSCNKRIVVFYEKCGFRKTKSALMRIDI